MKRKELIQQLLAVGDDDMEVSITDGYECLVYEGAFLIALVHYDNGNPIIDIGIGGLNDYRG